MDKVEGPNIRIVDFLGQLTTFWPRSNGHPLWLVTRTISTTTHFRYFSGAIKADFLIFRKEISDQPVQKHPGIRGPKSGFRRKNKPRQLFRKSFFGARNWSKLNTNSLSKHSKNARWANKRRYKNSEYFAKRGPILLWPR